MLRLSDSFGARSLRFLSRLTCWSRVFLCCNRLSRMPKAASLRSRNKLPRQIRRQPNTAAGGFWLGPPASSEAGSLMDNRNERQPHSPRPFQLKCSRHSLKLLNLLNRMVTRHRCRNLPAEAVAVDSYRELCQQRRESLAVHCCFRELKV